MTGGSERPFWESRYCCRGSRALAAPPEATTPRTGSAPLSVPKGSASTVISRYGPWLVADADCRALPAGAASKLPHALRPPALTASCTAARRKEAVGVVDAAVAEPAGALTRTTASDAPTAATRAKPELRTSSASRELPDRSAG